MVNSNNLRFLLIGVLSIYGTTFTLNATNQTYFSCKNGFEFETKENAARCVRQERVSYRLPLACSELSTNTAKYKLVVDKIGQKDVCILDIKRRLETSEAQKRSQISRSQSNRVTGKIETGPFTPKCQKGFILQIRRGKDACEKGRPEVVLPPTNEVKR